MIGSQSIVTNKPHLPGNILMSGYSDLQLTTQFVQQYYIECLWGFHSENAIFFNFVFCGNVTLDRLQVTCMEDSNIITTSLVVTYPLNTDN